MMEITKRSATQKTAQEAKADSVRTTRAECVLHSEDGPVRRFGGESPLPPPIGGKLRQLRKRKQLTLGDVEAASGISKSMLSQIERGKVNPTFATLWNLTRSLDIGIGELLEEASAAGGDVRKFEHVEIHSTPVISSADGLVETRILSPRRSPVPVEWYEVVLQPGGVLRANAHGNGEWEHTTVVSGSVIVEIGEDDLLLQQGETVRYSADQPHGVRNETGDVVKLFLVVLPLPGVEFYDLSSG